MSKGTKWFAWHPVKVNGKIKWLTYVTRYRKQKLKNSTDYTSVFDVGE